MFDTASLASFISVSQIGDAVLNTFDANVSQIYKQFGFALAKNGSTANLNIGDNTLTVRENDIRLLAKDSSLLKAQEPNSKVNWQSDNYIQFERRRSYRPKPMPVRNKPPCLAMTSP